jgi:hypothetical protein
LWEVLLSPEMGKRRDDPAALPLARSLGGQIVNGPITYAVNGKQFVAIISGNALFAFALRE